MEGVQQTDELLLAKVGGGEPVRGRHVVGGRRVGVEGVDVGQEGAHLGGNARTKVLGRQAVEVGHGLWNKGKEFADCGGYIAAVQ